MIFFIAIISSIFTINSSFSQVVPIDNYSINGFGQVQLSIEGQLGKYYILHAQHSPTFNWATSLTIGVDGTMIISESSGAYPLEQYSITEHDVSNPDDYDEDGIDDITEFNKVAISYKLNDCAIWINGQNVGVDIVATMPSGLDTFDFNQGNSTEELYGKVRNVQVFNKALTDRELEILTIQ